MKNLKTEKPPIEKWVLFADSKKTMGDKEPFFCVDKLNKRGEAHINYSHNYTHWQYLPALPNASSA